MRVFTEQITDTATLTGYVPDASPDMPGTEVRPAVLVLPGGGYRFCSDREAEPVALAYLAEGFTAYVLRYATGEHPWEASMSDGLAGLDWVRRHAARNATDPGKIAVVGFSAGGHLAASLGASAPRRPDALVLGYPVTRDSLRSLLGKEIPDAVAAVDDATPPTFVFATQDDETVPVEHSLAFCSALARRGIAFESHIYLRGPHGLSLAKPHTASGRAALVDEAVSAWLPDSVRFLWRIFGAFPTTDQP